MEISCQHKTGLFHGCDNVARFCIRTKSSYYYYCANHVLEHTAYEEYGIRALKKSEAFKEE